MTSDVPAAGGPSPASGALGRLTDVLARASGRPPTPTELAELLWLAGHSGALSAPDSGDGPTPSVPRRQPTPPPEPKADAAHPRRERQGAPSLTALHATANGTARSAGGTAHASLLAPAPPMLAHPLPLQRALRPLKRRVSSPVGWELDEERTADRIARLGAGPGTWVPALRPASERWLDLHMVFDSGPTMPIWRPLLRDLHRAIAQTGVFRTVDVWLLTTDGTLRRPGTATRHTPPPRAEAPPVRPGRTVTLLISDAMGPLWQDGGRPGRRWYRTLHDWATRMPVALVQPLPERLWRRTALSPVPGLISAPGPGGPNSALAFAPYGPCAESGRGGVPLPVLEPTAHWLAHWSAVLAGPGGVAHPGTVAYVPPVPPAASLSDGEPGDGFERLTAEELVLRFRAVASPEAFRLAGHVAVGEPLLPVMRLVHSAIEERPQAQQLAEVILSGMLRSTGEGPGCYTFRPGVRDVLLRTLPRSALGHTAHLLSRVSAEIESRAGAVPGEFQALVPARQGPGTRRTKPGAHPFALVSPECLRLLRGPAGVATQPGPAVAPDGTRSTETEERPVEAEAPWTVGFGSLVSGRYRLLEPIESGRLREVWRAIDERLDRLVAVKLFRQPAADSRDLLSALSDWFLHEALDVASLEHPGLVTVHDFGAENDLCYLVMELVEGTDLRRSPGRTFPLGAVAGVGRQVASALAYLNSHQIVHGDVKPANILMTHEGRAVVCDFGITWAVDAPASPWATALTYTEHSRRSNTHGQPGTPLYMSPERITGGRADHRSDLYALGCVLYEMTTGVTPLTGTSTEQLREQHVSGAVRPPRELRPEVPEPLQRLILDLLAKDPARRPSAPEVCARLDAFQVLPSGTATVGPGAPEEDPAGRLRFEVLGPVRVWRGSDSLPAGSPRQQALLTALLLKRGRVATAAELIEAMWGAEPPAAALAALRTYAFRLRKVLGGGVLQAAAGGYALRLDDSVLDLQECEHMADAAEEARATGDAARGRDLLSTALLYWKGEPLAGIPGPFAERERALLKEWRLALRITLVELALDTGDFAAAVTELDGLVAEHPRHEPLRELQMRALLRSGRSGEALDAHQDVRRVLVDDLGAAPGPELTATHRRTLESDPALAASSPRTRTAHVIGLRLEDLGAHGRATPELALRLGALRTVASSLRTAFGFDEGRCFVHEREDSVLLLIDADVQEGWLLTRLAEHLPDALADALPPPEASVDLRLCAALYSGEVEETRAGATGSAVRTTDELLDAAARRYGLLESGASAVLCVSDAVRQRTADVTSGPPAVPYLPFTVSTDEGPVRAWIRRLDDARGVEQPDPELPDDNEPWDDIGYDLPRQRTLWWAVESACQHLVGAEVVRPDILNLAIEGPESRVHLPEGFDRAIIRRVSADEGSLEWNTYETYEHGLLLAEVTVEACITFEGLSNGDEVGGWTSIDQDAVLVFDAQVESSTWEVDLEFKGTVGRGRPPMF